MKKNVLIFAATAGGGHVANAKAIKSEIERVSSDVHVAIADHWKIMGLSYNVWIYNFCLKRNLISLYENVIRQLLLMVSFVLQSERWLPYILARFLRKLPAKPDLIVSNSPIMNLVIARAMILAWGKDTAAFYIIYPDLAEMNARHLKYVFREEPTSPWPQLQNVFFQCCTQDQIDSVLAAGYQDAHIIRAKGLVVGHQFYDYLLKSPEQRRRAKETLGFKPDLPLVCVAFGGYGSALMLEILKGFQKSRANIQLIFICGHNNPLLNALRHESEGDSRILTFGYVDNPAQYLAMSDYLVGKPGPTTVAEALLMNVTPLILSSGAVMEQEQSTVDYIHNQKLGRFFKDTKDLIAYLETVSADSRRDEFPGLDTSDENDGLQLAVDSILTLCRRQVSSIVTTEPQPADGAVVLA